jgi:alkanesulfonate monooxygenase SsuD/methylene tetrahydromethanopterin reductase-like flavin-dependent oxidoreductase (luciferase family)
MKIGIGIPNAIPGTEGQTLIEWARRAEAAGFSSLATIGRVAYPSYESLVTLAAAAAVTERVGLVTNALLGPTWHPVLLAKEAASVDQISGGRFVLGVGVGARPDDFRATGMEFATRGRRWDEALEMIHQAWRGELVSGANNPVTPPPVRGDRVPMVFGGMTEKTIERTVKWGIGWTAGAGAAAADQVGPFAERVRRAWKDSGREGDPQIMALSYFALGEGAEDGALAYLSHYYGEDFGSKIARSTPKTPGAIKDAVKRIEDQGVDELFLDPTIAHTGQVDALAEIVL